MPDLATQISAAIQERLDENYGVHELGAALLAVLELRKPFLAELTSDGEIVGYQCMGCGPVEDYGSVHYPCETVLAVAKALGVDAAD